MKCRELSIRQQALALLESSSHKEAFWDSSMASKVSREIIQIEDEGTIRTTDVVVDLDQDQANLIVSFKRGSVLSTIEESIVIPA